MAEQYWIGGFYIDLSRNQITQNKQSQIIAPKALAVLTCLAENKGKVVSQDTLLTQVWQGTVVSPNTLQRSIAQLRKALGDDSKTQLYIKTHAKQGYSLECEVRWQDLSNSESAIETLQLLPASDNATAPTDAVTPAFTEESEANSAQLESADKVNTIKPVVSSKSPVVIVLIFLIILLGFIGVRSLTSDKPATLNFTELRLLTATDNKEFAGIYSPDGEYIVFQRYSEKVCINSNLWAKNIKTQQETQLTQQMGAFGSHRFSKDGKKLVFIESESCNKPITQKNCYKLMSLDFDKALASPQSPTSLMECKNSRIAKPTWLNNNDIVLMQNESDKWKLTRYSLADNKTTVIYTPKEGNFYDYDYSVKDDLIALTRIDYSGDHYIELLQADGQLLSSHVIEYPAEIPSFRIIYPNFIPMYEQLVFSTGRQLFTLSYQGKITNISLPLDEPMGSPITHPDGNRMLVIKGHWDSDIATVPLSEMMLNQTEQGLLNDSGSELMPTPTILERSTLGEDDAMYQPHGELIAFKSGRSGENQIWLTDGNGSRQLTHFPIDTYIDGLDWAADGKSILVNVNNKLVQVYLDSSQKSYTFNNRIEQLYQWNSEEGTVLLTAHINGVLTFGEFTLNTSSFNVITNKRVTWAVKSEDGQLLYTDHLDRFWQPGPAEHQLVETLENQGSEKRFITKDNVIYGVNGEFQLWSYDLSNGQFELIGDITNRIDYLTDINQTDILFSVRITAKKEVAELLLSQ